MPVQITAKISEASTVIRGLSKEVKVNREPIIMWLHCMPPFRVAFAFKLTSNFFVGHWPGMTSVYRLSKCGFTGRISRPFNFVGSVISRWQRTQNRNVSSAIPRKPSTSCLLPVCQNESSYETDSISTWWLAPRETMSLFPRDPQCFPRRSQDQSRPVFCYTPNLKLEKPVRNRLLYASWLTNLPRFQGARPDHVGVESSCCCFPRELVSFDPRHVTRSSPIEKRIWVAWSNKSKCVLPTCSFSRKSISFLYERFCTETCLKIDVKKLGNELLPNRIHNSHNTYFWRNRCKHHTP